MLLTVLLTLLLAGQAPLTLPAKGDWVGTMEFEDSSGLRVGRVRATIAVDTTRRTISGDWRTSGGASGALSGTLDDKGRAKFAMTFFGAAGITRPDGQEELIAAERCQADATIDGVLHAGSVLRLTTNRVRFDTAKQRVRGRECEDITRVLITLQPLGLLAGFDGH